MEQGKFYVFEGIDGAGKGTQIALLAERLKRSGADVELTREPTGGNIGRLLREYLTLKLKGDDRSIAALFAADRLDHIFGEGGLLEAVSSGKTVLCDRYYLSSYAYHSVGIDMDWVISMNSEAARSLRPAAHIFIDVSPETAMKRILARGQKKELFEETERLARVRSNYFAAMEKLKDSENFIIADGEGDPNEVAEEIWKKLSLNQ